MAMPGAYERTGVQSSGFSLGVTLPQNCQETPDSSARRLDGLSKKHDKIAVRNR
jgi:hypothetical protein